MTCKSTCSDPNLNVKHVVTLFEEVQNRYANKLLSIDEKSITTEERHKRKLTVYESYVKDLTIQTRLLLQSLDELEKEANQRVVFLENNLKKAQASLQHYHSLSDLSKTTGNWEKDKWKLSHENLDLKHDLDSLTSFISTAKRTGKWDSKRLQLKSVPFDRIIGLTTEEVVNPIPLHKEIQYRDERIQVLQAEIEHLRQLQADFSRHTSKLLTEDDLKGQNLVLSKKVDDLRTKLAEECQKSETFKVEVRSKVNQLKDLQQDLNEKKHQYEEHIHDLSSKLKTISDRHRESTSIINEDIQMKKQQIEQLIEEKTAFQAERAELERQCRAKDSITADLESQIRTFEQQRPIHHLPLQSTVSRIDYEKLDQELHLVRKRLDGLIVEKEALINKVEQDIRFLKKIHDEQLGEHLKRSAVEVEQLQTEVRSLKRICEEKTTELHKQSSDLRICQEHVSVEHQKNNTIEHEQQHLRNLLRISNEQVEKLRLDLQQSEITNEQSEETIRELNSRHEHLERQLLETITLIDSRNQSLLDLERMKLDLFQKQKENLEKQSHIDQLQEDLIHKTAEVAQLTETLDTDLIKTQQRQKLAEDHATKTSNDIQLLQHELRHASESLLERERKVSSLTEQVQQLTNDLRVKQDQHQQLQKSSHKQLTTKQDQLVRYDQNLHEAEIKCQYAKEECLIQEKEIARLNTIQEEQEEKILVLQQDLSKVQEQRDSLAIQYESCNAEVRTLKMSRENENHRYNEEFDTLQNEIGALRVSEVALLKNLDDLKENLRMVSEERQESDEQNENSRTELENIQKLLYEETESGSIYASKVGLLTRQFDEEHKRANHATNQLNDLQLQLTGLLMSNETLKSELNQARLLLQEHNLQKSDIKQDLNELNNLLDERTKSLDDCHHQIETLNDLISHLQRDYEQSQNALSLSHDQVVQHEIGNQTIQQHLTEKTQELTFINHRLHQLQQDFHSYEKEHRYTNDEHFQREQRLKTVESELTILIHNHQKLQKEYQQIDEQFHQIQRSDREHREQLIQSTDEGQIYRQKLAFLGECFRTIVRKASESSECWATLTTHLDEQVSDLNEDVDRLSSLDERFEQSIKLFSLLRSQHEDVLGQYLLLKSNVARASSYLRDSQRKFKQKNEENRHFRGENKRLHEKIDQFHREERLMHQKIDEQESSLDQLHREFNNALRIQSEAQSTIGELKDRLDELVYERDQLLQNTSSANQKIEKLEYQVNGSTDENRLFQQTNQKLEKQLITLQSQKDLLQKTTEQNDQTYQEKINQCESLLISLKEAHQNALYQLEQKKTELNSIQSELQTLKYEHSATLSKLTKFEQVNQEYQRRIAMLERSIDEHKRLVRKREKELEQIQNQIDQNQFNSSSLNTKCTKQDTEIGVLRLENISLNEELRLMRENVLRCQEEQRRLRKGCDQALTYIQDEVPEMW